MVLVMLSEFVVDWVKHAFITKFNEIPSEVDYCFIVRYHFITISYFTVVIVTFHYVA